MLTLRFATRASRVVMVVALLVAGWTARDSASTKIDLPDRERVLAAYANLPLAFVENHGQTDARVRFYAQGSRFALHLTPDSAMFSLVDPGGARGAVLTVNQATTASQFTTGALPTRRLWWRVRANDSAGAPGAWSSARRFELKNQAA